ncbi:MAG: L-cysteate sulfo-lyase [Chloroflexota bacterium]|nr:L-cysteate sulfo-lyase [Chloroflexota bacterium]
MLADRRDPIGWGDADSHGPMIRAGTIRRVVSWNPDPGRFPRFALLDGPSPFAALPRFSTTLGGRVEIWIKREDLLPLAFGGNKLRNLEFLVGAALAEDADTLVTSGRRWSNHARLTAAAGAKAGLAVHLVLSGPPAVPPNPGVRLDELLGATIHQAATDERAERLALVERVLGEVRAAGGRPFLVPVGGSGIPGALGQVLAGMELIGDAARHGFVPDCVVVPSATGGTQAGLLVGIRTAGSVATVVRGVAVTPLDELRAAIADALVGLAAVGGLAAVDDADVVLDGTQLGDGYGHPTAAADEAARLLARTEGILVDPIYTAKALAGLIALVRSGRLDGGRAVFWHAGGTPGIFEPLDP